MKEMEVSTHGSGFNLSYRGWFPSRSLAGYREESTQAILCHDIDPTLLMGRVLLDK